MCVCHVNQTSGSVCAGTSSVWAISTRDVIKHCTVLPDAVHMLAALSQLLCAVYVHISHQKQNKTEAEMFHFKDYKLSGFHSAGSFLFFLHFLGRFWRD